VLSGEKKPRKITQKAALRKRKIIVAAAVSGGSLPDEEIGGYNAEISSTISPFGGCAS
jgi:hypothetical protein